MKGLGPVRLNRLRAMGIYSLRDLLYFFPIRYEDHVHVTTVSAAGEGEVFLRGIIPEKPKISYFHGISRVTAQIQDASGRLPVCWFNEPWMVQQAPVGREVYLYGRVQVKNGRKNLLNPRVVTETGWSPVYRQVKGIPGKNMQALMREALSWVETCCPETLPGTFRKRMGLLSLADTIRESHFPTDIERLKEARRRLDFEGMLMYLMGVQLFQGQQQPGWPMEIPESAEDEFWQGIPFTPTQAQKRVLDEIGADMRKNQAMSRLVQGDVGCGKTALAFGAMYLSWRAGFQSAMMAPTEILARQHYENAKAQLEPRGMTCALLTGSTKAAERKKVLSGLKSGNIHAIFGTHALISDGVEYGKLGLVITDEQHRFGVRQRSSLQEKGIIDAKKDKLPRMDTVSPDANTEPPFGKGDSVSEGKMPHVLVMSATPIPRTLALILYGDLDLSLVDELPPGRKPVITRLVPEEKRNAMYQFLRQTVERDGHQAYVVCPLVEESENLEGVRSAQSIMEELNEKQLKGLRIGCTWGTQKNEEKTETLHRFAAGELDVLVATTVIEVGVNVPNATIMVIENAERYGLSQLHQLRGRVGRGTEQSWCFLLSSATKKLKVLCETGDGFVVAQKDLEIRGPGDLMGTRQSGEAADRILGGGNVQLLDEVQRSVQELMDNPALQRERETIEALTRSIFSRDDFRIALN